MLFTQRHCEYTKVVSKFTDKSKTNEKTITLIASRIRIHEIGEAAQFCA